jgi:murein DD-endopeptidase MepM/ murein hydrolase activator NlpD
MKYLAAFTLLFSFTFALNVSVKNAEVANGATVLVELEKKKGIKYKEVVFDKKKFDIFASPSESDSYYALLPVSYYDKVGEKTATIHYLNAANEEKSKSLRLEVVDGEYKKEKIQVSSKKVNPKAAKVKKRISEEYKEAMKIYTTVSKRSYLHRKFLLPIESNITSPFGTARVYNGLLKGYHSGTDFRAKVGTPIKAANDGKVVLVKKRFYSGGTVLLNHGQGIYTCYFHMSKFHVKNGAVVKRGDVLGLSGKSGRVTGPHLHFSARINGVQVDPLQLIALMNNTILKGK